MSEDVCGKFVIGVEGKEREEGGWVVVDFESEMYEYNFTKEDIEVEFDSLYKIFYDLSTTWTNQTQLKINLVPKSVIDPGTVATLHFPNFYNYRGVFGG